MDSVWAANPLGVAVVRVCVEDKTVINASDDIVRVEQYGVERLMALGLSRYEAITTVENGIDWRTVEALVQTGYPLTVALANAR